MSVSLFFLGCGDDDDDNDKNDLSSIVQTSCKGKYITGEGASEHRSSVAIAFCTDTEGYCDYRSEESSNPIMDNFTYSANGKLLVIYGSAVGGNWLLKSKTDNSMTLERGVSSSPSTKVIMVLEKVI